MVNFASKLAKNGKFILSINYLNNQVFNDYFLVITMIGASMGKNFLVISFIWFGECDIILLVQSQPAINTARKSWASIPNPDPAIMTRVPKV